MMGLRAHTFVWCIWTVEEEKLSWWQVAGLGESGGRESLVLEAGVVKGYFPEIQMGWRFWATRPRCGYQYGEQGVNSPRKAYTSWERNQMSQNMSTRFPPFAQNIKLSTSNTPQQTMFVTVPALHTSIRRPNFLMSSRPMIAQNK